MLNQMRSLASTSSSFSSTLAGSFFFRKRSSTTFFSMDSRWARGMWWVVQSSARGQELNMLGIHLPWTEWMGWQVRVPLALRDLRPSWLRRDLTTSRMASGCRLRRGMSLRQPLMQAPVTKGWWLRFRMKLNSMCGLSLMNCFRLGEPIASRIPAELPPKSQKQTDSLRSWNTPLVHITTNNKQSLFETHGGTHQQLFLQHFSFPRPCPQHLQVAVGLVEPETHQIAGVIAVQSSVVRYYSVGGREHTQGLVQNCLSVVQHVQQDVLLDYFPPHHVAQNRPSDLRTDQVLDYWHEFALTHQELILQNLVDRLVLGGSQEGQDALVGTISNQHLEESGHVAVAEQQHDVGVGDG